MKLGLVERTIARDAAAAARMVAQAKTDTNDALENLRDLARGIYPPVLADQGLAAALRSQARKAPMPVDVEPDGVGRYPEETEAAVLLLVSPKRSRTSRSTPRRPGTRPYACRTPTIS